MTQETYPWPAKLTQASVDRGANWAARLGTATISGHSFEVEGESTVTLAPVAIDGKTTHVRISGGVAGETAIILASVTASDGQLHVVRFAIAIE